MKVQCDVCNKAEAEVLCCADEAVLCKGCDEAVHAANKLSQMHQRRALLKQPPTSSFSSQVPSCDVCQERKGYFFCLQDRAILCKDCDTSTHLVNPHGSSHQRFFFGGVKVSLQSSAISDQTGCSGGTSQSSKSLSSYMSGFPRSDGSRYSITQDIQTGYAETTATSSEPYLQADQIWSLDEIFNVAGLSNYEFPDMAQSKPNC